MQNEELLAVVSFCVGFLLAAVLFIFIVSSAGRNTLRNDLIKAKQGYYMANPETGQTTFTNTSGIVFRNIQ